MKRASNAALFVVVLFSICLGQSLRETAAWADNPFQPIESKVSNLPYREWTDDNQANKVEARFVAATEAIVQLQLRSGDLVTVPRERLSERDRGYVEGITSALALSTAKTEQPAPKTQPQRPTDPQPKPSESAPSDPADDKPNDSEPADNESADSEAAVKEIELPALVGDASLAAGGKLLLLHLPKTKKVAVYDIAEGKITEYLSLGSETARIAGGLSKMVVLYPNEGIIERWSLETFKKETTRPMPFEGVFKALAMGYAGDGPLMLHWAASTDALARAEYKLFEIEHFKPLEVPIRGRNSSYRDAVHIRASAVGDVFGMWATSHSPQGMEVHRLVGDKMETSYQHTSAGHIVPNYDGSAILTGYAGLCTPELNRKKFAGGKLVPLVPTTHARFYVGVPTEPGAARNLGRNPFDGVAPTLYTLGVDHRLIDLPALQLGNPQENASWTRNHFTLDKRVYYAITENRLISIPYANDRLIVQTFDCRAAMDEADLDYIYVTSVPPRGFQPGKTVEYQIEVASSVGAPRFELNSGPEGMTVDAKSGLLKWPAPKKFSEREVHVIVSLTAPDGQSLYETFRLAAPPVKKPAKQPPADEVPDDAVQNADPPPAQVADQQAPAPRQHGLQVLIQPEGMFRSLAPNPAFHAAQGVRQQPVHVGNQQSPARARLRVFNRSEKTIDRLQLSITNSYPPLLNRTIEVDALRGVGNLKPDDGVEFVVNWPLLPGANLNGGAARIQVQVTGISHREM